MALRYAVANGNWSSSATWNGGTLPTSADDVYANNFTVTIDQNITVLSLRNTAGSPAVAGGKFVLTNGIIVDANGTGLVANNSVLIEFNLASPNTATLNYTLLNITVSNNANGGAILLSGTGTLNCNGNFRLNDFLVVTTIFRVTANGILNVVGNCLSYQMNSGNGFNISALSATLNWTGNMPIDYSNQNQWPFIGNSNNFTQSTINVVGNLRNSLLGGTGGALYSIGISNLTGNITSTGNASTNPPIILTSGAVSYINGILDTTNSTSLACIRAMAGGGAIIYFQGNAICSAGVFPFEISQSGRLFLNGITQMTFQTNVLGINKTLYEPGTSLGNPAITDVRNGVTYASGSLTGTLIVPPSGSVALGVPVGNTVGTAMISITDMGALLASYVV
jgi:hypothetical protein